MLANVGRVVLAHAQLEHALKMTMKTLRVLSVADALKQLRRRGSRDLRKQIAKLGKEKLGSHEALPKLLDLLIRAEGFSTERNRFLHDVWAVDVDSGQAMLFTEEGRWEPLPTAKELRELARDIRTLVRDLNEARLSGFLNGALKELGADAA